MCRLLGVAPSSYYAWRQRQQDPTPTPTAQTQRQAALTAQITDVFTASHQTYGCRRIHAALGRQGIAVGLGTVATRMRAAGLRGRTPRRFRPTTTLAAAPFTRPDRLGRQFAPADHAPGATLVSDITYLPTDEGWTYLAVMLDLGSRAVLGWGLADHLRTELVTDALAGALGSRSVAVGATLHSDRGTQYTAAAFVDRVAHAGLVLSCGAVGACWDNAVAEAFFATLKGELLPRGHRGWPTRAAARQAVLQWIEGWYNRHRLHSSLGYRTPWEVLTGTPDAPTPAEPPVQLVPRSGVQAA